LLHFNNNNNNNNNNNKHEDIYSAVIMAEPLREFTRFIDEYTNGARWPPTFGPSQSAWAAGPPIYRQPVNRIHHRHLLLLLSPKADTHFTVPRRVEG